jgi:stress response protein SCP2
MTIIQRGFRGKAEDYWDVKKDVSINLKVAGPSVYDTACFGLDASDKLSNDAYMVFYNQKSSPNGEIVLERSGSDSQYRFNVSKLPPNINKLAFTISVDGDGVMSQAGSVTITLSQKGGFFGGKKEDVVLNLTGADFGQEKALIGVEIYKKDVWRFSAVATGFNGGLSALLKHYGGEEAPSSPTPAQPFSPPLATLRESSKISLEKRLEREAPELISLAKPLKVILEKNKMSDVVARVGLVMDISGSMAERYNDGTVQDVVNKTVPLAVQFDDDGELDFWYFGSTAKRMDAVTLTNYKNAVPNDWMGLKKQIGGGTYEPAVIKLVINEYRNSKLPAYILFITDGSSGSEKEIRQLLIEASKLPIFWQFVGLGGYGYGVLERLDTMSGRYVDNANFFAIDSFRSMSDETLYDKLLFEFPMWLKEAKKKNIF